MNDAGTQETRYTAPHHNHRRKHDCPSSVLLTGDDRRFHRHALKDIWFDVRVALLLEEGAHDFGGVHKVFRTVCSGELVEERGVSWGEVNGDAHV